MSYVFGRLSSRLLARTPAQVTFRSRPACAQPLGVQKLACCDPYAAVQRRPFGGSGRQRRDEYQERAKKLNQKGLDEQEQEVRARQHQVQRPWHREGADEPPTSQGDQRIRPGAKGKLLTTPTRLLKLVLPLPVSVEKDKSNNGKDYGRAISSNENIQPLALLVHPQQPLSYLERLIQAELPPVVENGREKIPNVYFRAENTSGGRAREEDGTKSPHVASYSGLGHEAEDGTKDADKEWVRWSSSTEIGDFIRDAARGREFAIEIEGYNVEMRVGVPSFNDRTYYMRLRLRRMARQIDELDKIKRECDALAHRSARRLAKGGFGILAAWWGVVYYLTFETSYGWDLVEPVTYLAGLATIMGGYLWFLYISRDLSYKAAMNITVSRRQNALYESKGFDIAKWEQLLQEANALRKEIRSVAVEYDHDWDEMKDLGGERVKEVLERDKAKQKNGKTEAEEEEEDEKEGRDNEDEIKKIKAEQKQADKEG